MFTQSQSTIFRAVPACILSQYHWDKAFHFPGQFHFLVKTVTDSVRLGVVYLNLVVSTANRVIFNEIYLLLRPTMTSPRSYWNTFKCAPYYQPIAY